MLKINIVKIDKGIRWERIAPYLVYISDKRSERCNRYIGDDKKIITVMTELLIRTIANNGAEVEFKYNEFGKPYIEQPKGIYFSVSHSGEYIAYVQDSKEIGIDIEKIGELRHDIASRFFTSNELKYVKKSKDTKEATFEVWTRKEAYLKKIGTGLSNGGLNKDVLDDKLKSCTWNKKIDEYMLSICADYSLENTDVIIEEMSVDDILDKLNLE